MGIAKYFEDDYEIHLERTNNYQNYSFDKKTNEFESNIECNKKLKDLSD